MREERLRKPRRSKYEVRKLVLKILADAGGCARWKEIEERAAKEGMTAMVTKRALDYLCESGRVIASVGEVDGVPARFYALPETIWPKEFQELYDFSRDEMERVSRELSRRDLPRDEAIRILSDFMRRVHDVRSYFDIQIVERTSQMRDEDAASETYLMLSALNDAATTDLVYALCRRYPAIAEEACRAALKLMKHERKAPSRGRR
jgi:hypothetical protein